MVANTVGLEGGMEKEVGIRSCKLLYMERISNKVQLYSTGKYSVSYDNGKEFKKNA